MFSAAFVFAKRAAVARYKQQQQQQQQQAAFVTRSDQTERGKETSTSYNTGSTDRHGEEEARESMLPEGISLYQVRMKDSLGSLLNDQGQYMLWREYWRIGPLC